MSIFDLPPELLPRIIANPGCARNIAQSCRELSTRVSSRIFSHTHDNDGGVIASAYYTFTYKWSSVFLKKWNKSRADSVYADGMYMIMHTDRCFPLPRFIFAGKESWLNTIRFRRRRIHGYIRVKIFTGIGAKKREKRQYFERAESEWRCGYYACMLIGRQYLCRLSDSTLTHVLFGKAHTIMALGALIGQCCVVYTEL